MNRMEGERVASRTAEEPEKNQEIEVYLLFPLDHCPPALH